jgi:hypothetical protein
MRHSIPAKAKTMKEKLMSKLPANVVAWQTRGKTCTIGGVEIFYRDIGGTSSDAVLFLHGFPSSSYDWHALWPLMGDEKRMVCLILLALACRKSLKITVIRCLSKQTLLSS